MRVRPAPGLKVRDPISKVHIPEGGCDVPETSFWFRRLRSGDVLLCAAPVVQAIQIPDSQDEE